MQPYDPNNPHGQPPGHPQQQQQYPQQQGYPQQQYPQQQGYPQQQQQYPQQQGSPQQQAQPAKKSGSGLIVLGVLMIVAALACVGYAGIRYSEVMDLDVRIDRDKKTLKNADEDSSEAKKAKATLDVNLGDRAERMSEITILGPLGGGLLVFGVLFAVLGGRKKKS